MKKDQNTLPQIEENIVWKRTKIVLKFWWRHFLVIPIFPILLITIFKMDVPAIMACVLAIMFFSVFDNLKCNYKQMKSSQDIHTPRSEYQTLQQQQPWNHLLVGTPAHLSNVDTSYRRD